MRFHLIAVGTRMPDWVDAGFREYAKRLPAHCALVLHEVLTGPRGKSTPPARAMAEEAAGIVQRIPEGAVRVALDMGGKAWSTEELASRMQTWQQDGRDVALLVGGPDGLSEELRRDCELNWSLGPLTFPHALVRVIVAEQLYRAWSILSNHPYHRA